MEKLIAKIIILKEYKSILKSKLLIYVEGFLSYDLIDYLISLIF